MGTVNKAFLPCSGDGLIFTRRNYTALARSYGLKQEFITSHCPQQNGIVERMIRTRKEQCVHRQRVDGIQHAARATKDWVSFYDNRRKHQARGLKTPAAAYALAA